MGADIHLFIEYRAKKAGRDWETFGGEYRLPRNYSMFGKLAGVRNISYIPVAEGRGLPSDTSRKAESSHAEHHSDYHSESWCTANELDEAVKEVGAKDFYGSEDEYGVVVDTMKSFENRGYEARAVFWFDN